MAKPPTSIVHVPTEYPTALIWMDESGSRSSANRFFVVGAVKARSPGKLMRAVQSVRDRHGFRGEFKFSEATKGTLVAYLSVIDCVAASDAHFAACVVNRDVFDPFPGKAPWQAHREVASQLLRGCINRRELVSVCLDGISTPEGIALDDTVRSDVNRALRSTAVVTACCLDSRTNDGIQLADLFAGAVAFDRRRAGNKSVSTTSPKARVAARLMERLGVSSFEDQRLARLNVATYGLGRQQRPARSPNVVPISDKRSNVAG